MTTFAAAFFVSIGRIAAYLPPIRGKNGAFLRLFDLLRLKTQHIRVDTVLRSPVRYRARLDLHSWLQRLAFVSGSYEADTVEFLARVHASTTGPGYALDIGANIGLIGIPLALMTGGAENKKSTPTRVICVEAVPDNQKALKINIELNSAQNFISVIGVGLGETVGVADIQVEGDLEIGEGTGTANILPTGTTLDPNGTYECVRIPIQISTLDTLMREGMLTAECKVIKIDTDGYDLKIIRGGRKFLTESRPAIYGEFSGHCMRWHGESIADVVEFAHSINYLVWQRLPGSDHRFKRSIDAQSYKQDLMPVPAEKSSAFAWCCQS